MLPSLPASLHINHVQLFIPYLGVSSSYLTVLRRYIDLLFGELFFTFITCNDVSLLPYACFGCVITFRNFNFVRDLSQTRATCALSEKKKEKKREKKKKW